MSGTGWSRSRGDRRLVVDWQRCQGRGLCFELLPEALALDDWGFPLVAPRIDADLVPAAREAVRSCPALALRLL